MNKGERIADSAGVGPQIAKQPDSSRTLIVPGSIQQKPKRSTFARR
jgi:hypothetical protein